MTAGRLGLTKVERHSHVFSVLICSEKYNCHRTGILMLASLGKSLAEVGPKWGDKSQAELA